jgi:Tfp pilus assembly protein PilV
MAERPTAPDPQGDTVPRWVKGFAIIAVLLVVVFVVVHLLGLMNHG